MKAGRRQAKKESESETVKSISKLAALAVALIITACVAVPAESAETAFQKDVTVTNGAGSWTYSEGVNNQAFSAWKPTHFWFRGSTIDTGLVSTVTVKRVRGTVTNATALATFFVGSNAQEAVFYPTNTQWLFRNDTLLATYLCTNSRHGTLDITGVEQ